MQIENDDDYKFVISLEISKMMQRNYLPAADMILRTKNYSRLREECRETHIKSNEFCKDPWTKASLPEKAHTKY